MTPKRLIIGLILLLALGLGWGAWWWHATSLLQNRIEQWAALQQKNGWVIRWQDSQKFGFPFTLGARLINPEISNPMSLSWHGPNLEISSYPVDLTRFNLAAPGLHQINLSNSPKTTPLKLNFGSHHMSLNFTRQGMLENASLEVKSLTTQADQNTQNGPFMPSNMGAMALTMVQENDIWHVSLGAKDVTLPRAFNPMGQNIQAIDIRAELPIFTTTASDWKTILENWSNQGGIIEIRHASLDWQPLKLEGEGSVGFDGEMEPLAAFVFRMDGLPNLLQSAEENGQIDRGSAQAARIILQLLTKPDGNEPQSQQIALPVTIQDQILYLGPAKMLKLPRLNLWNDRKK